MIHYLISMGNIHRYVIHGIDIHNNGFENGIIPNDSIFYDVINMIHITQMKVII